MNHEGHDGLDDGASPTTLAEHRDQLSNDQLSNDQLRDRLRRTEAKLEAVDRSQAVIEFTLDGTIIDANQNFLEVMGYELREIQGQHHRMFCDEIYTQSTEYREFWSDLGAGRSHSAVFKRLAKGNKPVWINASYHPIFAADGTPQSIIKHATDVSEEFLRNADFEARVAAISRSQAVIEFNLDGSILTANQNFLDALGYELSEIVGQHHQMFCEPRYAQSPEYQQFWERLRKGQFDAGEYLRRTKTGEEIWINASYNPVFDKDGQILKVIKFATDITEQKQMNAAFEAKMAAIGNAQAVIEFDLQGNVTKANENFLRAFGYAEEEVIGKHHRMFCKAELSNSPSYTDFWKALAKGEAYAGVYERVAKDGQVVWINGNYNPLFGPSGEPIGVIKIATDVTEEVVEKAKLQSEISIISESLVSMSESISGETDVVASNAQSLGATTEEMSGCVEELSASIDSIAQNTQMADEQARKTRELAEGGAEAVSQSVEAMELINKSSEEIKDILMVISEIASQTNLLAFNAAIEAARAGEHGLGFSVVADEVRKLAERSSQATQNISKLIGESTKRIERGSEVSRKAGDAFQTIVDGVVNTAKSIAEISTATVEQQTAARDVASSIDQVATAAETSAGATHQIASSTRDLADEANKLKSTMSLVA